MIGFPLVWTIVTTTQRIQRAQRLVGVTDVMSGWLAGLLWVFTFGIGGIIYTQSSLNKVWKTQPAAFGTPGPGGLTTDPDLDRMKKLTRLKESGSISEEEFQAEKARVMPQAAQSQATPGAATSRRVGIQPMAVSGIGTGKGGLIRSAPPPRHPAAEGKAIQDGRHGRRSPPLPTVAGGDPIALQLVPRSGGATTPPSACA